MFLRTFFLIALERFPKSGNRFLNKKRGKNKKHFLKKWEPVFCEKMRQNKKLERLPASLITSMLAVVPLILSGCLGQTVRDFNRAPEFSPVQADIGYRPAEYGMSTNAPAPARPKAKNSLYQAGVVNFYRDPRATKPGDVLTVLISINDRANLNNKSDVKRDSKTGLGIGGGWGWLKGFSGDASANKSTSAKGDGKVERREDIHLSVAAIISDVLPNGNLIIRGSQEVRVNYEMRVLNVSGVVRPRDIAGNNTIDYAKIAEARISYGGRGRLSEIQQPPYGQQLLNHVSPF